MPDFQEYFDELFAPSTGGPWSGFGLAEPDETIDRLHFESVRTTSLFFGSSLGFDLQIVAEGGLTAVDARAAFNEYLSDLATGTESFESRDSWEGFIAGLRDRIGSTETDPFLGGFSAPFNDFLLRNLGTLDPDSLSSNWIDLQPGLLAAFMDPSSAIFDPTVTDNTTMMKKIFSLSFDRFISTLPFSNLEDIGGPDIFDSFLTAHYLWLGQRAAVGAGLAPFTDAQHTTEAGQPNFVAFRDIYFSFVRNATEAQYKERLVEFVTRMISENGYFMPSHFMEEWFVEVQFDEVVADNEIRSTTGTESFRTQILFELFALVVEMLEVLQRVSAAQASRLQFFAAMQKAYTNLVSQIPVITKQSLDSAVDIDPDSETFANLLQRVTAINQSFTEKLRSFRSVVGDEGKQHQTSVNQSTEVVNQQAQLGTSILQQMSTILTTIFK